MLPDERRSIIQEINDPLINKFKVRLLIKRDDLIHPEISGNKWRKLKYNLEEARRGGHHTLLSFGGAFSNHILALASAGEVFGFKTIGVIRGESTSQSNPTLSLARQKGMALKFISRTDYRAKDSTLLAALRNEFGDFYLLPEGGTNCAAIQGCSEITSHIDTPFDYFCCSVGTGGTFTGALSSLDKKQKALGFSSLKGDFLSKEIEALIAHCKLDLQADWHIDHSYHFGGYAKFNHELIDFINQFKTQHGIQLDPIYTGKLLYGVYDQIRLGRFNEGATVLVLHSGGLQGIEGFNQLHGNLIAVG